MATFTNQATLSYQGGQTSSNITTGQLLESLAVTKTAVNGTYVPGGTVTYAVSLRNTGTTDLTGVTLTDDLGAYAFGERTLTPLRYEEGSALLYQNGVVQTAPAVTAGPPLSVTGLTVPAGGSVLLLYRAEVTEFAPADAEGTVVNTVTVTSPDLPDGASDSETVAVLAEPRLRISKALCPTTVTSGGQLTYTFVIENDGPVAAEAADAAVLTDVFDPVLRDLKVSFNGAAWTEGADYTYVGGVFTTVPGKITVPAAAVTQDAVTGAWQVSPGSSTLTVTGTV